MKMITRAPIDARSKACARSRGARDDDVVSTTLRARLHRTGRHSRFSIEITPPRRRRRRTHAPSSEPPASGARHNVRKLKPKKKVFLKNHDRHHVYIQVHIHRQTHPWTVEVETFPIYPRRPLTNHGPKRRYTTPNHAPIRPSIAIARSRARAKPALGAAQNITRRR